MPTPPMPPDVSGVGPNWYLDDTWTTTIVPNVTSAQNNYDTSLGALNAFIPVYTAKKEALQNFLNNNPIPADIAALEAIEAQLEAYLVYFNSLSTSDTEYPAAKAQVEQYQQDILAAQATLDAHKQTLVNLRADFFAAKTTFYTLLNDLKVKSDALLAAYAAAASHVDTLSDAQLTQFATDLAGVMNKKLTLPETVSNNLDVLFSNANSARLTARAAFLSALSNFQSLQSQVSQASITLQDLQDQYLLKSADVEIDKATLASYEADLAYHEAQLAIDLKEGTPAEIAQTQADIAQDQANIAAATATLAADEAAKASLASQVTAQNTVLQNLLAQRDTAQQTLATALSTYHDAIDLQISYLKQAAFIMENVPAEFMLALAQARQAATQAEIEFLEAAKAADIALRTQHFIDYPDVNPIIQAEIAQVLLNAFLTMQNINAQSVVPPFSNTSQINLPQLPAAGHMSMSQLIQFLTLVAAFFSELLREIRRTDARVNEFRLSLFATSYGSQADATSRNMAWANTLQAQDTRYDNMVVYDNHINSKHTVDQIQDVFDNVDAINAVIDQLNKEIDEQNSRGVEVITDYNTAIQQSIDNLKLQLYQDYGQLSQIADELSHDVNALLPSDPSKAPLLTVVAAVEDVLSDLRAISADISTMPIDSAQLALDQAALASHQAVLTAAIGSLPPINDTIQGELNAITKHITIVMADQDKLYTSLTTAQTNAAQGLSEQIFKLTGVLDNYQQLLAAYIASLSPTHPSLVALNSLNTSLLAIQTDLGAITTILQSPPVDIALLTSAQAQLVADFVTLQSNPTNNARFQLASSFAMLTQLTFDFKAHIEEIVPNNPSYEAVLAALQKVSDDFILISNDLSSPQVNFALLAEHQELLADDLTALEDSITALGGSIDPELQADITAIQDQIALIMANQTSLITFLQTDLQTELTNFSTLLTDHQTQLNIHITSMAPEVSDRQVLFNVISGMTPVQSDLSAISVILGVVPVDASALADAQVTLVTNLTALQALIPPLPFHNPDITADLTNIATTVTELLASNVAQANPSNTSFNFSSLFDALAAVGISNQSITDFINAPTATPALFPNLPAQARTPLLAGPTLLPHYPRIDVDAYIIPESMPTANLDFTVPPEIQGNPTLPPKVDIDKLNAIVHELNQLIVPLLPRLQAAGVDVTAIDPLFVRGYIPIRAPSNFFTYPSLLFIFLLIFVFILGPLIRAQQDLGKDSSGVTNFIDLANLLGNLPNTGASTGVQGTGSGAGLLGATLFNAPGHLGQALQAVLNSSAFQTYVDDILSQIGLVGGLSALSQLPTSINNWSEMGLVQSDASLLLGTYADGRILTAAQQAAVIAAITELVNTVSNVPAIRTSLSAILESVGPLELSDDELAELISQLLFLIQLIGLLIAAILAAAAGGEVNIDRILEQAFASPQDQELTFATRNLEFLGIQDLPTGITPASPTFIPRFLDAIRPQLGAERDAFFTRRVSTIFSERGITLETDVPLGTAVENALNRVGPDVAAEIRRELNRAAFEEADRLRGEILRDESRRPALVARITQEVTTQLAALPPERVTEITTQLETRLPQFVTLKPEEKKIIVLAIAKGLITPEQVEGFVNEFLREAATLTTPTLALIVGLTAIQLPVVTPVAIIPTTTPTGEPILPVIPGTLPGTPGEQPGSPGQISDTITLIAQAFRALSKQTDEEAFTQQVAILFANLIRNQTDFFQKSLSLILNPANTYVKNFSIVTRDDSLPGSHPTISQIPIAG